jgi:hypothetical protein
MAAEGTWLTEQIKTVRNLCDIAMLLVIAGKNELLPTILELLYEQAQSIIDDHCVIKHESS